MEKSFFYLIANRHKFSSLQKSVFYLMLFLLNHSCYNPPIDPGDCILYCNPAECLILNEERCVCCIDFQCILENYYGIDTGECNCNEEDGGIWCSALTGESGKTWKFVYAYDPIRNETISNKLYFLKYYNIWDFPNGLYQYRPDHIYIKCLGKNNCLSYDPDLYLWYFDNVIQPTKIIYKSIIYKSPNNNLYEYERTILKLNPDTLITTWNEGEFPGWIVLVPYDG